MACEDRCRSKCSNTQNRSEARPIGHYIRIPKHCLSVFKLGRILTLFSRLIQSRLAKSIAFSPQVNSIHRIEDHPGLRLPGKQPWLARMITSSRSLMLADLRLFGMKNGFFALSPMYQIHEYPTLMMSSSQTANRHTRLRHNVCSWYKRHSKQRDRGHRYSILTVVIDQCLLSFHVSTFIAMFCHTF